jgi:hypothetical protein
MSRGYLVWLVETRQVIESRDCVFYEEFAAPLVPGHVAYDGSQFLVRILSASQA